MSIDELNLQALKIRHELAVQKMINAIDEVNELKCRLWKIEAERILQNQ